MPRQTIAELRSECADLRHKLWQANEDANDARGELADLKLKIAKLEASQGEAKGRALAWESAYSRLVRHYELVHGSPEAISAIAQEEDRMNRRNHPDHFRDMVR